MLVLVALAHDLQGEQILWVDTAQMPHDKSARVFSRVSLGLVKVASKTVCESRWIRVSISPLARRGYTVG